MRTFTAITLAALAAVVPDVHAELPPPTAAEVAAQAKKKAYERSMLEDQKQALAQALKRVVARYAKEQSAGGKEFQPIPVTRPIPDSAVPGTALLAPVMAGPHGGTEPSAEAHSSPEK